MADNVAITPGAGANVATDDVGGVQYQRMKVAWGADGTANDADTASGKGLPTQVIAGAQADGHSVTLGLTTDAAAQNASGSINAHLRGAVVDLLALLATLGATTDAAVSTDADGSVNAHLRGALVELIALLATAGATGDATVAAGATGSLSAKLRRATQGLEDLKSLIVLAAGENHVGAVGGSLIPVTVTFARPADTSPYTAGDVVSNNTTTTTLMDFSGLARVTSGTGYITGALLVTDKKSVVPRFRVHLFNASAPTRAADNAAHKEVYADVSKRVGQFDLPAMTTPADTTNSDLSHAWDFTLRVPFVASGGTHLYALLETLDGFTPANAENFSLTLWADGN